MSAHRRTFIIAALISLFTNISILGALKDDAKAADISGGEDHTLVLTADKSAWACGPNGGYAFLQYYYGVLGTGSTDYNLAHKTLVRVHDGDMNTPTGYLENIDDIDAGWMHSLALDLNGFVWSWGWNSEGQLGDPQIDYATAPVRVLRGEQPDDPCEPSDYLKHIMGISAGRSGQFSLAFDANFVYAWGMNQEGQLGNDEHGVGVRELTPVKVKGVGGEGSLANIIAVSAGADHSMALEKIDPNLNGSVYTWGANKWPGDGETYQQGSGKLGNGTTVDLSDTPVRVLSGEQYPDDPNHPYLQDIVAISAGWNHCMALEKYSFDPNLNGRVYTWGSNGQGSGDHENPCSIGGRLGDGTTADRNTPVLVLSGEQDPCSATSALEHITAVSAGEAHSMALDVDHYVYTWGDNYHGQLGDGTNDQRLTPVRVVGQDGVGYLENIVAISAGYWHSLAIDADGVIWTWGKGSGGQLGLGNTIDYNTPHRIPVVYNITQETFHFTIQSAIDDANDAGDTLEASPGTYFEDVDFLTKTIKLRSAEPNNADVVEDTVIQGSDSSGPAVKFTYDSNSILTGFTIAAEGYEDSGIKCDSSSPTISNCVITDNAGYGVDCNQSTVRITNCIIRNNGDDGITCSACDVIVRNCIITNNSGEGIFNIGSSSASITNSIISGNNNHGIYSSTTTEIEIINNWIYGNEGSGIVCYASSLNVKNCVIEDNADYGIYEYNPAGAAVIANNIVRGNGADGIYSAEFNSGPEIRNNWIYANGGSGIKTYNYYTIPDPGAAIVNNTIVNNDVNGVKSDYADDAEITSSIIWNNGSNPSDNLHATNGTFSVAYSCVEGTPVYDGTDNINSDPCFVDPDANDFHLGANSLCIDTGDPDFEPEPNETDIDGGPRVINDQVDMGADEFWATDFNRDGLVNFVDYAMLAAKWRTDPNDANYNDDFDLAGDDSIDFRDISVLCENWLLNAELWPGPMSLKAGWSGGGVAEGLSLQVAPYELSAAEEKPLIAEPVDVEKLLDWLAQIWLDPETQKVIDAEAWLKLYESVKDLE